jgi:hypothetical protein
MAAPNLVSVGTDITNECFVTVAAALPDLPDLTDMPAVRLVNASKTEVWVGCGVLALLLESLDLIFKLLLLPLSSVTVR